VSLHTWALADVGYLLLNELPIQTLLAGPNTQVDPFWTAVDRSFAGFFELSVGTHHLRA